MRENKNLAIRNKIWKESKQFQGLNVDIGRIEKLQIYAKF